MAASSSVIEFCAAVNAFLGLPAAATSCFRTSMIFLQDSMAVFERAEDFLFGDLLRAGFDHHDALVAAGHDHVELRRAGFRIGGIGDVFAIDDANAHGADEVVERNIGNGERGAGADDGEHAGIVLGIGREHHRDDLRFVEIAFREQAGASAGRSCGW